MAFPDDMPDEGGEDSGKLEEISALASAAFPGVDVDPAALKDLIRHCMADYGPDEPAGPEDPALAIVMGSKPKK